MDERQAVAVRQAKVHEADIRRRALKRRLEFRRTGEGRGAEPRLLQRIREHPADFRFVVEDGDMRAGIEGAAHAALRRDRARASSPTEKGFDRIGMAPARARCISPGGSEVMSTI